jgi:hypothetical protein
MTQSLNREFALRYQVEQLKGEAGALRLALIRLLQEGDTPEAREAAYVALSGEVPNA